MGLKNTRLFKCIRNVWKNDIPEIMLKMMSGIFANKNLQNIIVIESHNDFDMNGGALYQYLIRNEFNKKYKIVWLIKNKKRKIEKKSLPNNVKIVSMYGPSIARDYYNCVGQWFFYDCCFLKKIKKNQIHVYLGHATRAMKNCRGLVDVPDYIDYIISSSEFNNQLMSDIYKSDISKFVVTGFPVNDCLFDSNYASSSLIKRQDLKKQIMWMPTFRGTAFSDNRDDGRLINETGLPLIDTFEDYNRLNLLLKEQNIRLIIKFHQAQNMEDIKVSSTENITLLSPELIKKNNYNTYELMAQSDALISDYSSVSFDFLLLDRPIAYVLSDYNEYKLGFAVDNPKDYMPGNYIYVFQDLCNFFEMVSNDNDECKVQREKVRDTIHKYKDGYSCKRIIDFLRL